MRLWNVRVCRSLRAGRIYVLRARCTYNSCVYTHGPATRVRFPCRVAVWVDGTHGRRKQRIMVITVIKRQPLRTRPGSTWKIRCFTSDFAEARHTPWITGVTTRSNAGKWSGILTKVYRRFNQEMRNLTRFVTYICI